MIVAFAMTTISCDRGSSSSSGPARITVEIFDRGSDGGRSLAHDNAWTDWIKAKVLRDLNIEVTFVPVGRWSENTDIVNLMASGDAPDLCYTYNQDMIASFREMGGILNLAPYINSHLPDMRRLLGDDPALPQDLIFRDRLPTGEVFSVVSYVVNIPRTNIFIRKDWLDRLGLPLPSTTQEFYQALVAFRDRASELPGSGGRNNVIPFGMDADARWATGPIAIPFFDPNLSDRDMWIQRFMVDRPVFVPGYKDAMRMINQWYNEGLIYRDFPIARVADDTVALLKTGRVGAYAGNWDHPFRQDYRVNDDLAMNVPGAVFVPVDCILSPDGITRKDISDKPGLRIFVPAFSKNPEAALRYLNWLCIPENYQFLQIGHQGINHVMENGVPRVIPTDPGHQWIQNSPNNIDITMPMNGIELGSAEMNARVLALGYGNTPAELIVEAYRTSTVNGRAAPVHVAALSQLGIYGSTLADKIDVLLAQAITATPANFDRIWDAGIQDLLNSGARAVMEEREAAWPR